VTPLAKRLAQSEFSDVDIVALLALDDPADIEQLRRTAYDTATREVGDEVYFRGLIELSNICIRDCHYCGIRKGNRAVERYTLDRQTIVEAAAWAARAGYGSP
jgi:biotin synthase